MRTALEGAHTGAPRADLLSEGQKSADLLKQIVHWLDDAKAEEIVTIDLAGKSSIGDFMVVATGRSDRHVGAIAEQIGRKLKELGLGRVRIEGMEACDWVLLDTGDIIVHVFRDEVRDFYNLEKMWSADRPGESTTTAH
jgi:ribosome-associated protein